MSVVYVHAQQSDLSCFFFFLGKYLRQKRIDFQLPYDILWLWKHDQVIL